MVLFLLNIIFSAIATISNLVSRLILTGTAYLLVLVIQAFKVPGGAAKGAMEYVADSIKSFAEYMQELLVEVITTLISTLFDMLKEGVSSSAAATGSVIGGLLEQMRGALDGLLEGFGGVLAGFWEMVSTVITDLWNNYTEAVGYVTENA